MKTQSLFLSAFIATALLTSACTPRDPKLDADPTVQGQGGNGGGSGKAGANGDFNFTNFPIVSFIAERHIEVIELVKLATGSLDQKRTQYQVDEVKVQDGTSATVIRSSDEPFIFASNEDEWKVGGGKEFQVKFNKVDKTLNSLEIVGTRVSTTMDSENKSKTYANLSEKPYKITVKPNAADAGLLDIEMTSEGSVRGAKGAAPITKEISLKINMSVVAASLETNDVQIVNVNSKMIYPNQNPKATNKFDMPFTASSLIVKLDSLCNSLEGKADASAGKNFKFVTNFDKSSITVDNKGKVWKSDLAECGKRPTVDLSRFHSK